MDAESSHLYNAGTEHVGFSPGGRGRGDVASSCAPPSAIEESTEEWGQQTSKIHGDRFPHGVVWQVFPSISSFETVLIAAPPPTTTNPTTTATNSNSSDNSNSSNNNNNDNNGNNNNDNNNNDNNNNNNNNNNSVNRAAYLPPKQEKLWCRRT